MDFSLDTIEGVQEAIEWISYSDETEENEKILQKCIQRAQFFKDKDLEFAARIVYIRQVAGLKKPDKTIAVFPWLLKRLDEGYNQDEIYDVLWMYKWVIIELPSYASISLTQIETLQKDMERRFLDYGTGTRLIHYFRMLVTQTLGDMEKAQEHMKCYLEDHTRSVLDDCRACQSNSLLNVYLTLRDYSTFLSTFESLLISKICCEEVPDLTYAKATLVNQITGNVATAKEHAILARKKIPLTKAVLTEMGYLLIYYALTEDFIKGRSVIEKQFTFCNPTQPDVFRYNFYLGCLILMKALEKAGKKTIKLKISVPDVQPVKEDSYAVSACTDWFEKQCLQLVQKLDTRNQNQFYADDMAYYLSLLQTASIPDAKP